MRKKGRRQLLVCGERCEPLDEQNDFTWGVESQTFHFKI